MKVLCIMGGFLPGKKFGGPPISVDNFCSLMKDNIQSFIVTHNHDMGDNIPYQGIHKGWNDRGNAKVLYLTNEEFGKTVFDKVIRDIHPDLIYIQSLFQRCTISCLMLAKKHGLRVMLAPRGELCSGAFKKKYKKIPYILLLRFLGLLKNIDFQSTSNEETNAIAYYLGANIERIHLLTNIPSIPNSLSQRDTKIRGEGKFVFISRILWKKNLLCAINYFKTITGNVGFDIFGPKEDEEYWKECELAIASLPKNIRVEYKGVLSHDEIHKTFNKYDAFLFPTISENYGHVIAEALVTGCIPIISDQTPWTDINDVGAGWAIPLKNEQSFVNAIRSVVQMDEDEIEAKRGIVKNYLNRKLQLDKLKKDYLAVFNN